MNIEILHLLEGAKKAHGLTVIIDVFRAFSLEAYMFDQNIETVYPVSSLETAYDMKRKDPSLLLIGERDGKICEGFDFGNSPSSIYEMDLSGKKAVHTTSAGTQGVNAAENAEIILGGSLVNAKATADYIRHLQPRHVSLVCMGLAGVRSTEEDILCAEYIKSLLEENPMKDIAELAEQLRYTEGKKFFDPAQQSVFPEQDFHLCIRHDVIPYAIHIQKLNGILVSQGIRMGENE